MNIFNLKRSAIIVVFLVSANITGLAQHGKNSFIEERNVRAAMGFLAGDALQGVLLDLVALEGVVAGLKADAPCVVGEDAAGLLGIAEIVAKEGALEEFARALAVAGAARGAVNEDHGHGHGDQDDGKHEAEVLLKIALNPGNHGGKRLNEEMEEPLSTGEAEG